MFFSKPARFSLTLSIAGFLLLGTTLTSIGQPVPSADPVKSTNLPESPQSSVNAPSVIKQGNTLVVTLQGMGDPSQGEIKASFADRTVKLFPDKPGQRQALIPVSVFQKPGTYQLKLLNALNQPFYIKGIQITDARFPTQNISVSKAVKSLEPLPGEMEAIAGLKSIVTEHRYWQTPFISPTTECQNSPFGVIRKHNGVATGDYHKGVDLRSPAGRDIKATNGGKVVISKMYRLHGGTVGIDHGHGVSSVYIHQSKLLVKEGQIVKKGEVIGKVGSTGFASGPHLHWGLFMNGLPVNPNQWVNGVPRC